MKNFLTDIEIKELRIITSKLSDEYGRAISLGDSMNKWSSFVAECVRGYELCVDDYINDLSAREILEKIISFSSLDLASKLRKEVGMIDGYFLETTKPVFKALVEGTGEFSSLEKMLFFRIPQKCVGELREDLINMGLLSE